MKMKFDDLQQIVKYLPKESAFVLRCKYIEKFIDTSKDHYDKYIRTVKKFSDGICYEGYLWDCIINPTVIGFDEVIACREKLNKILIFWDINSKDRIFIKDYWKFGKDSMLRLDFGDFLDNIEFFPEDVYIFDESLEWSLVLTHEYDSCGINRICAKMGDI